MIKESVESHLQRSNYNDTADVTVVLELAGVVVADVNQYFPQLAELMGRRHHIVHQADRNDSAGHGQFQAKSISTAAVNRWIDSVKSFAADVFDRL